MTIEKLSQEREGLEEEEDLRSPCSEAASNKSESIIFGTVDNGVGHVDEVSYTILYSISS